MARSDTDADPPGLEPEELEMVAHLLGECGEVVQAAGKALQHGLESRDPMDAGAPTNRRHLETEIGHVLAGVDMLIQLGILDGRRIDDARDDKYRKVGQWLHHVTISGGTVAVRRRRDDQGGTT